MDFGFSISNRMWDGLPVENGIPMCPDCHTPRAVMVEGKLMPCLCRCQEEAREREERESEERERKARTERLLRTAFSSAEMRECTFEADDGRYGKAQMEVCRRYAERCAAGADYGLLMFGEPDGGKTFASCCIANRLIEGGKRVVMRSVPQLIIARNLDDEQQLRSLLSCDLLILDDLGAERSTSYAQEFVYAVVDGRYQQRRPMVVSTNLTRTELYKTPDITARRTYNRILEVCLPVEFNTGRKRATAERYEAMRRDLGLE